MAAAAYSVKNNEFNLLARRAGYNLALRHFRATQDLAAGIDDGFNLADLLNLALEEDQIGDAQVRAVINLLLVEKFEYAFKSHNLDKKIENIDALCKTVAKWKNIQIVLAYTDSSGILHLINPESPETCEDIFPLLQDENIVCYAGAVSEAPDSLLKFAISDIFKLLYGGKAKNKPGYSMTSGGGAKQYLSFVEESPVPPLSSASHAEDEQAEVPPTASGGVRKLTAKMGVNVTNELFHNGNVEAWSKIIASYRYKHPDLDVLIWNEGERINDINALFKWGKVKHGVPIMFSVAGENPKDIAKLKKYLFEGASSRFEVFLHGAPGTILQLF